MFPSVVIGKPKSNAWSTATISYPLFSLEKIPIESSIQVIIDGETQSAWDYEAERNAVYFEENPPKLGNTVSITYDYYFE